MSSRVLLVLVLAALPFAACAAGPRDESPMAAAERVLAAEFGPRRAAAFRTIPERLRAGTTTELRRLGSIPPPTAAVATEAERVPAAVRVADHLVRAEAQRQPHLPEQVVPERAAFGQSLADALADLPAWLWPRRPLGEIDDGRHRTDPDDEHPEATLWQRLRRRLLP